MEYFYYYSFKYFVIHFYLNQKENNNLDNNKLKALVVFFLNFVECSNVDTLDVVFELADFLLERFCTNLFLFKKNYLI